MRARVKELLAPIVAELNTGSQNARDLWDILSALRGPDFIVNSELKTSTTAAIRSAIGIVPDHEGADNKVYALGVRAEVNPDGAKNLPDWSNLCALARELGQPIHFFEHASNAIDAIERKED